MHRFGLGEVPEEVRTRIRDAGTTEPGILREVFHPPFSQVPCNVPPPPHRLAQPARGPRSLWAPQPCWPCWSSQPGLPCPSLGWVCCELPFCSPPASDPTLLSTTTLPPSSAPVGPAPCCALGLRRSILGRPPGLHPQRNPRLLSRSQLLCPDSLGSLVGLSPPPLAPRLCTAVPVALI